MKTMMITVMTMLVMSLMSMTCSPNEIEEYTSATEYEAYFLDSSSGIPQIAFFGYFCNDYEGDEYDKWRKRMFKKHRLYSLERTGNTCDPSHGRYKK